MKAPILIISLLSILSFSGCSGKHNPLFDCDGLDCSDAFSSGLNAQDLSFVEVLEQGYWYSRYNLGSLVMKSGLGESFMPQPEMVKKMVAMVSDERSQATPPKNPTLLKRVFNFGNPQFAVKSNRTASDFSNFRWSEEGRSSETSTSAFAWTLMKEVEWSKLFNIDAHFGIPSNNDVPAAQQRFSGLALCAESIMQADEFIKDFNAEQIIFDYEDAPGMYASFAAISNLAHFINMKKNLPVMQDNRCAKVVGMMKGKDSKEVATEYLTFLEDFDLELPDADTIELKSLQVQAYSFYALALNDKDIFKEGAGDSLEELRKAKPSNIVERAYVLRALADGYRILKEEKYVKAVKSQWDEFFKKFDLEKGYFKSKTEYSVNDVAVIISALNAVKLFAEKKVIQRDVLKTFIGFFHTIVNDAGLQIAAPPVGALPKWEQKANTEFHRAKKLPVPPKAGGKFGTAPVFAASVSFSQAKGWTSNDTKFETAGAMHLANQMVWFHNSEVNGYPCPGGDCIKAQDIDPNDLRPPRKPGTGNGNGGGKATSFNTIHKRILTRCIGCHAGSNAPHGLDMSTPERAYRNLVGVNSVEGSAFGGVKRVLPGDADPTKSYIVAKLMAERDFRVGDRMPRGGPFLTESEIEMVKSWINAGAKK